ncbi:MAG TPA: biotin attachment protein [Lentisphaeria bacterium]|nr:MAG: biotin attachment protein [Lentisphaerae bacterium GWF2_38_69]HBM15305.1 biotin attachment protein [Lentisphaeria bacterium]
MKKISYMDTSFRDGFQSCYGARVKVQDFLPALEAAVAAGTRNFEIGGGALFQSHYFYCQEDAFETMDICRKIVGSDINLQTLARGANVVGLVSQCRDVIDLHAKLFKKHGISTIRNFDALNDVRNLSYSGKKIHEHGLKHQIVIAMMGLPPDLDKEYAHSPEFYIECVKNIIKAEIPFDSVCFKDASGTATPKTVYETIKRSRKLLPEKTIIQFHTHETAGMAVSCNMAAIEAGADIIDLSMSPCSGGTAQCDILTMWHRLKGTDYTLDIDHNKIIEAEEIFANQMEKYFLPPESREVMPIITFSPMPGGALTTNTQMMRDNKCLHLFREVIKEMKDVVALGGFGTSVTPVSQFYFQQAFSNVTQGKWKKITDSYGKMVLGYFGKTPAKPDENVIKAASEQTGLAPTTEDVHDINDRNKELALDTQKAKLLKDNLPVTEENIFIVATCGDKGLEFLKGNKPLGIHYKKEPQKEIQRTSSAKAVQAVSDEEDYTVTVDDKTYIVHVKAGITTVTSAQSLQTEENSAMKSSQNNFEIRAPMPGTISKLLVKKGYSVNQGDTLLILEAMKMETPIKTPVSGKVIQIIAKQGYTVAVEDLLLIIEQGV